MKRFKYLLSLFFLLHALYPEAQVNRILPLKKVPVNSINYEQGLLNNETAAIITDTLGFTWVSTVVGLQRYNGYTLENIDPIIGNDTIRIRSRVYFYALKNGNLWISCKKGVLEYNPYTNSFKNIIPVKSANEQFFAVTPLDETEEGIWCIKEGSGLVIYDRSGRLKKIIRTISTGILDGVIHSDHLKSQTAIAANHNHIFLRTGTNTLLDVHTADHRFDEITEDAEIFSLGCNNHFFFITTHLGLYKYAIQDKKLAGSFPFKSFTSQPVVSSTVSAIGINRLITSINEQVLEFDADLKSPRLLTTFNGRPLLLNGSVEHIYRDAFERIWLLTNDDIKRIQDKEIPFNYLNYPYANNNFVRCLYFDEQTKQLIAGCIKGGLQVYDKTSAPLWHDALQTNEVRDVVSICKLSDNSYLIITWARGWYLFDLKKRRLLAINYAANPGLKKLLFSNSFSNNAQRVNDSTILVASISNVFRCVFRGNDLKSAIPLLPFFKMIDDRIDCFYLANDGTLWTGQYQGLLYRKGKNGLVKIIKLPERFSIRCITEDDYHHVWIGTSSGLYIYTPDGELLKSFYKKSGLLNDCIYSLLTLPGKSSVIAGSNMGLSVISFNGNIRNYTKELGLQDNEFNTAAAIRTTAGKFYFGGVNGITAFYPQALDELQRKPILNMTKLVVNDSIYNSSDVWRGGTVRFNYNQNHLQFDFAALGPLNADKYFYRYRLIGFEKYWQNTHQPTGIRYILQPGTYMLEIACSNELSGTEVKKTFVVVISPPFWLTWWFFALVCMCVIGTVVLVVTFYNKRRYQKTLQEFILNQRLQNQRESISRDLHDNLGAQVNAIFYGTGLLKQTNDHEQKLVDNLHDTAGDMLTVLRETLWALKINEVEATNLWLRILNFARKIGNYYPAVKMDLSGSPAPVMTINASMALNIILIVQEAINNAVRHSEASIISITSYSGNNTWIIEIADDGKGFDIAAVSSEAESYGLENMAERATESNIAFTINSMPAHGTKISLEISVSKMESQFNQKQNDKGCNS